MFPPDGYLPAVLFADPTTKYQLTFRGADVPREPRKLPDGFERYDVTRTEAARIIGITMHTLDRWIAQRHIAYLVRPDGTIRLRMSDCYKAAGVVEVDADPSLNPHDG